MMIESLRAIGEHFRTLKNDYSMSKTSRFNRARKGLASRGSGADYHIRSDYDFYNDIEKARDMDRNDAVIGQMISRAADNEVQDGFTLEFNTGDKGLDRELKLRFHAETDNPEEFDIAGEHNFHDIEWYASRTAKVDGDCGISAIWEQNKIQFFEAHSIYLNTNQHTIVNGVELDEYRRRVAYHISRDKADPYDTTREMPERIETRDENGIRQFFHVYNTRRLTMSRGVTALAPVFEIAGMLEDINFAKLVQQQAASFIAILETGGLSSSDLPSTGFNRTTETTNSGPINVDNPDSPGIYYRAPRGATLTGFSPNIPNQEYFDQVSLILRMISVNLGLPLMMALLDGSDSTFHGYRGALDEARRGFKRNQHTLANRLHNPLTKWKLHRWIDSDAAIKAASERSDVDVFNFDWQPPGFPYVEPTADANGDVLQLRNNLNSPRRIQKSRGRDHETVTNETIEDNIYAIRAAVKAANELNASVTNEAGKVNWRDLINMPTPEGVTVSQSVQSLPQTEGSDNASQE